MQLRQALHAACAERNAVLTHLYPQVQEGLELAENQQRSFDQEYKQLKQQKTDLAKQVCVP